MIRNGNPCDCPDQTCTNGKLCRITNSPDICGGLACVYGTRVPVELVLQYLATGDSIEMVLAAFPQLVREDLLACLSFAAGLAEEWVP